MTITNSQIEQGPKSQNTAIIAFGEVGKLYPVSTLLIQNSLNVNDLKAPEAFGVWNAGSAPTRTGDFDPLSLGNDPHDL